MQFLCFKQNDLQPWHLACWFMLTLSMPSLIVEDRRQTSRSQRKIGSKTFLAIHAHCRTRPRHGQL